MEALTYSVYPIAHWSNNMFILNFLFCDLLFDHKTQRRKTITVIFNEAILSKLDVVRSLTSL